MLFMDALELDLANDTDGSPDLKPETIERELRKAAVAFASGEYTTVWSGPWGCGAFGGDAAAKITILWIAASVAGCGLKILFDAKEQEFGCEFESFTTSVYAAGYTAGSLRSLLLSSPADRRGVDVLHSMVERMGM